MTMRDISWLTGSLQPYKFDEKMLAHRLVDNDEMVQYAKAIRVLTVEEAQESYKLSPFLTDTEPKYSVLTGTLLTLFSVVILSIVYSCISFYFYG